MKLPKNVKLKKGLAACIPWLNNNTAQALYPNIYLPQKVYNNLKCSKPNPKFIAVLAHERKHLERQREIGHFRWDIKYSFCSSFRFNEELIATRAQMAVYKKYKKKFDIKKNAKYLSSWLYFWPVSYKTAQNELEKLWVKI
jgi:antirestriction protein ArdC